MVLNRSDRIKSRNAPALIATLLLGTFAIMALELAMPVVMLQVYDRVVPNMSRDTLSVLMPFAVGLLAADFALRYARGAIIGFAGAAEGHRLAGIAVDRILEGDARHCQTRGAGENLSLLNAVKSLKEFKNGYGMITAAELLLIPAVIAIIAMIAGPLALAPAILLVLFGVLSVVNGARLSRAIRARATTDDRRFNFIIETLAAMHTIKALAVEKLALRRYESLKFASCVANRDVSLALTRTFDMAAVFSALMTFSIVLGGAFMVIDGGISVGAMIASVLLSGRIIKPLQRALALLARRKDAEAEREKADMLLSIPAIHATRDAEQGPNEGRLDLRGVSHDQINGRVVLTDADFALAPGDCVTLEAEDDRDCGEVLRLFAGLRAPRAGQVMINGVDARQLSLRSLSRQVAHLRAESTIYRGTVMDNMSRFGEISLTDVLFVARLLDLEKDVAALPRGLETQLAGDGSDTISPGLKHRIALTRQLAPRPRLILFENADSGLDRRSYEAMHDLLGRLRGKATIVLASQDANLQALASRVATLEGGAITLRGRSSDDRLRVARYKEVRI